jgi:signal transduction histidine kinase
VSKLRCADPECFREVAASNCTESRARWTEEQQERRAADAVAEERSRIARELHDVVAHSVMVMVMQAGALRPVLPPATLGAATWLGPIEGAGRAALVEMRRMPGLLRPRRNDLADRGARRDIEASG